MAANSFRLLTFGGLHLERSDGGRVPGDALQRRLLLVALAADAGDRGVSRDRVIGLLWPESDEEHGRRSLNQLRYTLRRELDGTDLVVGTSTLRVDPARLESDLADFRAAVARGDADGAAAIHAAPFLDGVFAEGAPELDQWVEGRRRELRGSLEQVLLRAARAGGSDDGAALAHWRRLVELDPLNAIYAVGAMEALARHGDATGALVVADRHEVMVLRELGVPPDRAVADAAARIRGHTRPVRSSGPAVASGAEANPQAIGAVDPAPSAPAASSRHGRTALFAIVPAALAIIALLVWATRRTEPPTRPRLVVAAAAAAGAVSDSLADAQRLLEQALHREAGGRALPLPTVRATLQRMRRTGSGRALDEDTAREVAQREGMPWVLVGSTAAGAGRLAVRYQVEDAASGRVLRSREDIVRGATDLGPAIDRLVSRLDADLDALGSGPALSRMPYVTTASFEALQAYQGSSRLKSAGDKGHMALLERAVSLDSNFAAAHSNLAYGYWFEYDQARADTHAEAAVRSLAGVEAAERLWISRDVANAREDWPVAIGHARALVERNRESSSAWHALAQLLYFDGQYARSIETYDSAMAHAESDDSLTLLINRATVYAKSGRFAESADLYRKAFVRDSLLLDDPFIYLEYGAVLVHLGQSAEARMVLQRPLAGSARDRPGALRALALLEAFEGRFRRADELLDEAATASGAAQDALGIGVAHTLLAEVRLIAGDRKGALAELETVRDLAEQSPLPYEVLSRSVKLAARLGEVRLAGAMLAQLEARTRSRANTAKGRILMARGELQLAAGRAAEGRRALEQAFSLDPTDDLLESTAHAARVTGAARLAATRFDSLASGEGLDWDGYAIRGLGRYQAAEAWEAAGDTVRAREAYRAFAASWRDGDSNLVPLRQARLRAAASQTPDRR
jgi:DNA-binding SARP family transcriptional activator/Tfp pilus assembly protein PilF